MNARSTITAYFASALIMTLSGPSSAASLTQTGVVSATQPVLLAQYLDGGPGSGTGTGRRYTGPGSGTGMGRCRTVMVRVCGGGYGDGRGPRCRLVRQTRC